MIVEIRAEIMARLLEIGQDLKGLHNVPRAQRIVHTRPLRAERRMLIRNLVAKAEVPNESC